MRFVATGRFSSVHRLKPPSRITTRGGQPARFTIESMETKRATGMCGRSAVEPISITTAYGLSRFCSSQPD